MKFINRRTGVILEPRSNMVAEQLHRSAEYMVFNDQKSDKDIVRPLVKMSKSELLKIAQDTGIKVPDGVAKNEIISLIETSREM